MHKLPSILLVTFIIAMILTTLLNTDPILISKDSNFLKSAFNASDRFVASGLKKLPLLEDVAKDLTIVTGNIKRNGIYITDNYLLPDIKILNPERTMQNIERVHSLMERIDTSCYFALIPTAAAIKQQELPPQLEDLFNERSFITEVYAKMADTASTADIYSSLFSAKYQYTYFRNDLGLTALGGYYVYEALINRLGYTPMPIYEFTVRHIQITYYGSLA